MTDHIAVVGDTHLNDNTPRSRQDMDYLGTLLKKLQVIYDENEIVVFLGDLFEKPTLSYVALRRVMEFFLNRSGRQKTYAIMGNHDLPNLNPNSITKTALGLLEAMNLVNIIRPECPVSLGPLQFHAIPLKAKAEVPGPAGEVQGNSVRILLGHCFYENGLDPEYSITRNELLRSEYSYVFLGHDHSPYEPEIIGDTQLIRLGSVCRNTSESHNLRRTPSYFRFTVNPEQILSTSIQPIPCLPATEVFLPEVFESKEENDVVKTVSIGSLLDRFHKWSNSHIGARLTVLGVMRTMGVTDEIIQYVQEKYQAQGMTLK